MLLSTDQIYLWVGFIILGLADLYLYKYPLFHPIVFVPAAGWLWGDLSNGLIVGGTLELIFGLAQLKESRRLNLILYAGGLALFINQVTDNINLTLCITIALLLAFGLQMAVDKLKEWIRVAVLIVLSGAIIFVLPLGGEILGWIPAQLLNQMAIAGEILPWIFYAYALVGMVGKTRDKDLEVGIPAILVGSVLCFREYFIGPVVFVMIYYLLDSLLRDHHWRALWWLDWALLAVSIYFLLPNFLQPTLWVFIGVLVFNVLLVLRDFAPLEIYLLIFIAGIILSKGNLLT